MCFYVEDLTLDGCVRGCLLCRRAAAAHPQTTQLETTASPDDDEDDWAFKVQHLATSPRACAVRRPSRAPALLQHGWPGAACAAVGATSREPVSHLTPVSACQVLGEAPGGNILPGMDSPCKGVVPCD